MFPLIPDDNVRETKSLISMHSSNTFHDCDRMFIPDFIKLDETVQKTLKKKYENSSEMLEQLTLMLGLANS